MECRQSASTIRWIVRLSILLWMLSRGLGHSEWCGNMSKTTAWCGNMFVKCNTVKCVVKEAIHIKKARAWSWLPSCYGLNKFGYAENYIWTKSCCIIFAEICYTAKTDNSGDGLTHAVTTSHGQVITQQSTSFEDRFTITMDIFNTTEIMFEEVMPTDSEMKAEADIDTKSDKIGLYAGLPVGLFLVVALFAVVCFVFRDKLKTVTGKFRKVRKEELYEKSTADKTTTPYAAYDCSRNFANQEYAIHHGQQNNKSKNEPTGEYDNVKSLPEPQQNGPSCPVNKEVNSYCSKYGPRYDEIVLGEPKNTYDTTQQAADRGCFDPSYDHITGSNFPGTETPERKFRGADYDNANF